MSTTRNLLVELFVEELPPKALKRLGDAFATTLQLRRRGQHWRLLGVQTGLARYRGKGPEDFEQLGERFAREQKAVPGYLALAIAAQFATRGSAIKSRRQGRIEQKLQCIGADIERISEG